MNPSGEPDVDPLRLIVKPKLRAPIPRHEQVIRPRLLERLGNASNRRITLVSAPAGYGKTTLLAQWLQAGDAGLTIAWVSLDEQDNDPVRLWRHIVEALRLAAPEEDIGADVLEGMSVTGRRLIETSLPKLVNGLAELSCEVVLVLDDYQLVTEDDCHASVAFFVEHLPGNAHLVLSSRTDPPLPLGRWRARGEMDEVRTEQLAFSEEEADCLLNEKLWLDIGLDNLSVLLERTEGWPAGIYLASLSLRMREDKHAFIASFGGSNRYVVDLLGEEVLAGLREEMRVFLLMTSVLEKMTGSLCDAVVGREDSGILLRELAHRNLFVVPLDEQGEWYRYHHLFSELLLYELKSSRPELVPVLRGRASVWLEDAEFFDEAIRHALVAEDYERGSTLIARHWLGYVLAGQMATVEGWFESLPEGPTAHDAALLLVRAWICVLSGRCEDGERLLTLAESIPYGGPLPDGTASVEAGVAILRAVFGIGGVRSTLEAARRAVALEPELTSQRAALMRFGLGSSLYLSGETSQARKLFEVVVELTRTGQPLLQMISLSYLSIVATDEGRQEEAESLARQAETLVVRFGLQGVPQSSWVPIALGYALAKQGEMVEAQTELERGLSPRMSLPDMSPWPTLIALLALARVRSERGDRGGAREVLSEARTMLRKYPDAGIFPEHLEREERRLRARKPQQGQLDGQLTERELDVLRLLFGELSTSQIAQNLYVSPSTVRTHVKSIYRKLGVSSRKDAVLEARVKMLV
jgi:LuxR family transcriptional regulator, maltose regulon positive regulatory protein